MIQKKMQIDYDEGCYRDRLGNNNECLLFRWASFALNPNIDNPLVMLIRLL